jgi:hypothetical protein
MGRSSMRVGRGRMNRGSWADEMGMGNGWARGREGEGGVGGDGLAAKIGMGVWLVDMWKPPADVCYTIA